MIRVLFLCSVLFMVGCTSAVEVQLEPELTVFLTNDQNNTVSLSNTDEAYQELQSWLRENRDDWYITTGSFAGGVYVQTGEQGIQVTRSQVVFYSKVGDSISATHVQAISGGELRSVKTLTKP